MEIISWIDSLPAKERKHVVGDRIKEPNTPDNTITKMVNKIARVNKPSRNLKNSAKKLKDLSITESVKNAY